MRVSKWLSTSPTLNSAEKLLLIAPPVGVHGRIRAIKEMRDRSGRNLMPCMTVVDDWISKHLDDVHESVKTSYFENAKNRERTSA